MSNANRDYAIVYDVKNSSLVSSRPLNFYITDKNTSNIFIKLVTKVIVGNGIDQYTDIENASNYVLTMRVIKPNNEVKSLEATQHKPENIFQFDLTEDFKDMPGKYTCELTISTIVSSRQELITSDPFSYEVKRSILSNVGEIIETEDTTVEKLLNNLDATKTKLSSQIKEKADKTITDNIQQQVNNLVLGAVGDGNNAEVVQARGSYDVLNDRLNIYGDIINKNSVKTKLEQNVILQNCIKTDGTITPISNNYALTYYDVTNLEYIYINGELNIPNKNYCDYLFKDANGNVLEYKAKSGNMNISILLKVPTGATILYLGTGAGSYTNMCVYNIDNMQNIIKDLNINALEKMNNESLEVFNKSSCMKKLIPTIYNNNCVKNDGTIVPVAPKYTSLEFNIQNERYIYVKNLTLIKPNNTYCHYAILDSDNNVLEKVSDISEILNKLIYLPANSSKIRFTCSASSYADGEVLVYTNINDTIDSKSSYEYVDNSIQYLDKLYEIDNLFDKNSSEVMKGYNLTGDGKSHEDSNSFITNFIPVTADDTVYGCFIKDAYFVCYNAQKTKIGHGYINASPDGVTLANLQNVSAQDLPTIAYIRFSNPLSLIDSMTITTTPSYRSREHKVIPVKNLKESNNGMINFWEGKIGDSLGDSLTEARFFQLHTANFLNLKKFYCHGIGGSKLSGTDVDSSRPSMWQDSRINALSSDADFITILGGQNDGDVTIGDVSFDNTDTNTYVGALNVIISKIYAKYNGDIIIILCTPFYTPDWGNNMHIKNMAAAVRKVAELWGLPVADFGGLSGANPSTSDVYWGSDKIHPIEKFYKERLTPILVDTLNKIKPIDYTICNFIPRDINQNV